MPIKIFKRGATWHYRGTVAGRRLRGTTGTANKDTAQRIAAGLETTEWKRNLDGPEAVLTFAQAAMLYRAAGKPTRFLEKVEDHWKDTLVKDMTPGAIRQAAIDIYPNAGPATRNRQAIVPTQAIINHAAESELCPHIRVKRFKFETKIKDPASPEWIKAFMSKAEPHLAGLAMFMFATGARISEALNVRWEDVDLKARVVKIRQTKIGNERLAHIPPPVVVAIANITKVVGQPVFLYTNRSAPYKAWGTACKRAGIKYLSFHSCRHGFATTLLRRSVDVVSVAKLGGWKSPQHVFQTYGHASDDATLTDRIFDTPLTQVENVSVKKPRKIRTSRDR